MMKSTPPNRVARGDSAPRARSDRRTRRFAPDAIDILEGRQLLATLTTTYSATIPQQTTDFTNVPLSVPQFNPAIGTLDSVSITLSATANVSGTVTNTSLTPQSFTQVEDVNVAATDPSGGPIVSSGNIGVDLHMTQTYTNLGPNQTSNYGPFNPTQYYTNSATSGSLYNYFVGTGTANLLASSTTTQSIIGGGSNINNPLNTMAGATFTVTYSYQSVSIAGNVYEDKNGTGSLQPGDPPIPGTLLTLTDSNGTAIATTTTGPDGTYSFQVENLNGNAPIPPGTYKVTETQPAGYLQGTNTVGTVNGVTDGTLIPVDMIGNIVLTAGQNSINNNFGEVLPVTLAGNVYEDKNGTGSLLPSDPPIPGTTLTLTDPNGTVVATTTTGANGAYSFTKTTAGATLPPNTYKITETQPAGYLQGTNTVGTVNGATDGTLIPVDMIGNIVLTSGQNSVGNNFGEVLPVTLAGNVYEDANGTGSLQPGDPPIPGTTLSLTDASGTVVATTTTAANGTYSFTTTSSGAPLPPSTYEITETQPAGYLQGTNTVGTVNGAVDGVLIPVDKIGGIVLTSGQNSISNNFGELLPVTLAGNVYEDANGTGTLQAGDPPIPNTTLTLTDSTGAVVATTTTATDGTYAFTTTSTGAPLVPGTYKITETQPAGYLQGSNTVGTVNGAVDGTLVPVDMIANIALKSNQNSINNNFGELLPVTLAGNVYEDKNGTGSLQAGDPPIPNTTLTLTDASGAVVATTTTAANGTYAFTTTSTGAPLVPGTYKITETQPAGYLQGSNTVGTVNGAVDGTLVPVDMIANIALKSNQNSINNNFGEVLPVTVSGYVYDDVFNSGHLQIGDTPIPGTFVLLSDASGAVVASTQTNAQGIFSFTTTASGAPLAPSTYKITEIQPTGYNQGSNSVGTTAGSPNGVLIPVDMIGGIKLTSGQSSVQNGFGEVLAAPATAACPLLITNVQRYGVHLQPTLIVLTFDTPLNPSQAQDVTNYKLFGPTDGKKPVLIPITSAVYNPATNMVTLHPAERLNVHHPYTLTVTGLTSNVGVALTGNDGVVGDPYVATVNRSILSGFTDIYGNFVPVNAGNLYPAAVAAGYQHKPYVEPANLGPFAAANTATFGVASVGESKAHFRKLKVAKADVKAAAIPKPHATIAQKLSSGHKTK
jgi:hypothetical protein